ncbi:hypothetical protein Gotur_031995 [Gossypium turneri]
MDFIPRYRYVDNNSLEEPFTFSFCHQMAYISYASCRASNQVHLHFDPPLCCFFHHLSLWLPLITVKGQSLLANQCQRQKRSHFPLELKDTFYVNRALHQRITCVAVDEFGYETAPFSFLSDATDENGYFFATLTPPEINDKMQLRECKAFLENSPLEACKVPTDVNKGIRGAILNSHRVLDQRKMRLYWVGPFFYT